MKYAIFSDVHANLDALRLVFADADEQGAERFVCLGDIVGYGPQPSEALTLVRSRAAAVVAGNHDDAVSGRGDESLFIDFAADAVKRHREALSFEQTDWLKSLPYTCELPGDALCAHGDAVDPRKFRYVMDIGSAGENFKATDFKVLFVGHTHVPAIFLTGHSGNVYMIGPQDFAIEEGKRYIVNVGTVGYPRGSSGPAFSTYVVYDTDERTVCFRRVPFSVSSVMPHGTGGANGKRSRTALIAAAVSLVSVLLAAVMFVFGIMSSAETFDGDPARVVETRELDIYEGQKIARANITLAQDSPPLILKVFFMDADGRKIRGNERFNVKRSSSKAIKIPRKAVRVIFRAMQDEEFGIPEIESFSPSVSEI